MYIRKERFLASLTVRKTEREYTQKSVPIFSLFFLTLSGYQGFPGGSDSKESTCSVGDLGSLLGLGRTPGGGHGNPLQYSVIHKESDTTK